MGIKKFRIINFRKLKPVLSLKNIVKSYGNRPVLKGLSFDVFPAQIRGLLGPNGSGKTTIFQIIMGIISPNKGEVRINNELVNKLPIHLRAVNHGIGYVPQIGGYLVNLSVRQNIEAFCELHFKDTRERNERVETIISEFNLDSISSLKATNISGGEKRRLSIGIAMISKPRLILLDEPFSALDPQTISMIKDLILSLQKFNIACIVSDHQAASILEISDSTLILGDGIIIADDTPIRLLEKDSKARAIYFGKHFSSPF